MTKHRPSLPLPKPTPTDAPDISLILRQPVRAPRISTTSLTEYVAAFTEPWRKRAACNVVNTDNSDTFFPVSTAPNSQAKLICQSCEVRVNCLNYSIVNRQEFGIWGGMVPRERLRIRRMMEVGIDIEDAMEMMEARRYGRGVARGDIKRGKSA